MKFKSEIRDSQLEALRKKANENNYASYLKSIYLRKLRGFEDQRVTFSFPVTALVGPNGGGKTTVLGAAACAYKSVRPRRYFAKSGTLDDSMQSWKIEYEIVDKSFDKAATIKRTASFQKAKWSRDAIERQVLEFGVNRTVPPSEKNEYVKFAKPTIRIAGSKTILPKHVSTVVTRILGKETSGYGRLSMDAAGKFVLLLGKTPDGTDFSEFHFGAGESSVIKMVLAIEQASDSCLIVIEEIENGLHPIATVRMVEYLIEVAERKKAQIIFTTHSNEALLPLPNEAIWAAVERRFFNGKLDIRSLRSITHQIENKLVIFCEDEFAKVWIEAILRSINNNIIDLVEVHAMSGDGSAVKYNSYHNSDPSNKVKSICLIDGDSTQKEDPGNQVFRLPGAMPEISVFEDVLQKEDQLAGRLAIGLLQKFDKQKEVMEILKKAFRETVDKHNLYSKIGERLGLIPEVTVSNAFVTMWCEYYPEEVLRFEAVIRQFIPKSS